MNIPCIVCGTLTKNRKFCSILCYGLYQRDHLKRKTCPVCRKKHKNTKFCSFECQKKFSKILGKRDTKKTKVCETCGKNFTTSKITNRYCSYSCKYRKYKINEKYFDEITQDNAYILGVVFSIGQMINGTENKILLRHKDEIIIKMVKGALDMEYPIKFLNKYWELRPSSTPLVDRLIDLGFRKESKHFWFPEIPENCKGLFIQGMMDTSVRKTKSGKVYRLVRSKEIFLNMIPFGWKGVYTLSGIWAW